VFIFIVMLSLLYTEFSFFHG